MELIYIDKVESTQRYLKNLLFNEDKLNVCFYTFNQTNGIGSQNNSWQGTNGNLFFSFVVDENKLPNDLPIQSISIYFSYILNMLLVDKGSTVFLKWPNDFYINNEKIGGTITNKISNQIICGIGLNFVKNKDFNGVLDIDVDKKKLLTEYFIMLMHYPSWKQIFSKYKLDFHYSKKYYIRKGNEKISLKNAILNNDGSLTLNNKKVYSLR